MPRISDPNEAPVITNLRNSIIAEYGSDTTGLNMNRVNHFLAIHNIPPSPWVRIPAIEFASLIAHCEDSGFIPQENRTETVGMYIPRLGMSVLLKGTPKFRRQHPDFEDAVLVHEQFHASAGRRMSLSSSRRGLIRFTPAGKIHGDIFEEGLATIIEDMYLMFANGGRFIYRTAWSLAHDCLVLLARCDDKLLPALRNAHAGHSLKEAQQIIVRIGGPELFNILYACTDSEAEHADAYEATLRAISRHPVHRQVLK